MSIFSFFVASMIFALFIISFVSIDPAIAYVNKSSTYNSQTLDILNSNSRFSSASAALGGGDISVVDGVALASEIGTTGQTLVGVSKKNNGKISVYEVREGDTLSQIADMFEVSINTIRWANDFEGAIQPGQQLVILPVTGITHVVKNGGTIEDVADIYDADVREIALFNGLDTDVDLQPGDEIIVPNVHSLESDSDDGNGSGSSGNSVQQYVATKTADTSGGYYTNPVPGSVITQGLHGYNAIDFGAPIGSSVVASAPGKVITSKQGGWNGGYGNMIVVSHPNGTQTLYSHLSSNAVYVGQTVDAGDVIGYVGTTGRSTGPHLHFEVRGARNPFQ